MSLGDEPTLCRNAGDVTPDTSGIVLFGGFASPSAIYASFARTLTVVTGQPVHVVKAQTYDWIPSIAPMGWVLLLNKLHKSVRKATAAHGCKVTLIGHSAGGVLARLYLGPEPFFGRCYRGIDCVDRLITLGSPHYNRERRLHGGIMSRWIEQRYPGACFSDRVQYVSIAGRLTRGNREGTPREQHAFRFYQKLVGNGEAWGDGLIPVESALLNGSHHIVLEGVGHFAGFGGPWYGSPETVKLWWHKSVGQRT
jgi:triacylglycerol esterase/lipase EstA (alpha/beta hydrolase family)